MNPGNESNAPVVAYCRVCGRGLAEREVLRYEGTVYCMDHMPAPPKTVNYGAQSTPSAESTSAGAGSMGPPPPPVMGTMPGEKKKKTKSDISPGLAFFLGLIPGVGAIYNGQYGKGFVHFLVAGLLISLADHAGPMEPLFGMMIPVWFFYMAFEAYHTAKKRLAGEPVDEFSSIFPQRSAAAGFPIVPVALIAIGVLYLLNNMGIVTLRQVMPYVGPLFLIGVGCYLLYSRTRANLTSPCEPPPLGEAFHERN